MELFEGTDGEPERLPAVATGGHAPVFLLRGNGPRRPAGLSIVNGCLPVGTPAVSTLICIAGAALRKP